MYLVSVVHAGEVPVTPDEASAWQRLCPLSTDQLAPVPALAGHLDRPEVARRLAAADATRCPPDDVLAELRDLGVTAVFDPDTATAVHVNALNAVAARHSGSLAITLGVNALALLPLYVAGTPEQCRRAGAVLRRGGAAALLLTELDNGSNLARTRTRAEPVHGGHRLTGEKHLINGGTRHDLLVTLARVAGTDDLGLFLAERDETVTALPRWRTLPAAAADISGVRFTGTPADVIGAPGRGRTCCNSRWRCPGAGSARWPPARRAGHWPTPCGTPASGTSTASRSSTSARSPSTCSGPPRSTCWSRRRR